MRTLTALKFALLAALALAAPAQAEDKIVFSTDSRTEAVSAPAQDKQAAPAAAGQDHADAAAGKEEKPAGTAVNAAKTGAPAAGIVPATEKTAAQGTAETAAAALKDVSRPAAKTAYFEPRSLINY